MMAVGIALVIIVYATLFVVCVLFIRKYEVRFITFFKLKLLMCAVDKAFNKVFTGYNLWMLSIRAQKTLILLILGSSIHYRVKVNCR